MVPYLLKCNLLSLRWFSGWIELVWSIYGMFHSAHIWTKRQLTSLALLLRLSFLGTIRDTDILLSLDFNESASSIIDLAIWLAVHSEFRSLVPQWRITWSGLTSRIVGFTWSCMHLTFPELNGRTLTRHLCLSFTMLSPSMNTGDGEMTLSSLIVLLLLLLLISLLLLLLLSSSSSSLLLLGFLRLIVTLVPLIESLVLSVSIILLLLSLLLALLLVSMMLLSLFLLLHALLILEKYCYY